MYFGLRSDGPTAHLVLIDQDGQILTEESWLAERRLADELLGRIEQLLERAEAGFDDLRGLFVYRGPGSFTGLRIGITVMNTMAYALKVPIVGSEGEDWLKAGFSDLKSGHDDRLVQPSYGAEARITKPKK